MGSVLRRIWFPCLAGAYVVYALGFIYGSSVVVHGRRYFVLLDDAMISMTYARNIAHGDGAVWYPGAVAVEGYSNPLWTFYMAALHWLPLPASRMSLAVQLTSMVLIVATLFLVKLMVERLAGASPGHGNAAREQAPEKPVLAPLVAVSLTAFYLPLNNWALRGMEVGLLAFGVSLAAWAAIRCLDGKRYEGWLLPLLGLLTWVRMDAAVVALGIIASLTYALPERRGRILILGIGWLVAFLGVQTVARLLYYGDWLPNTYYLKLAGVPLLHRTVWGLYVLFHFLVGLGLWLLALLAVCAATARSKAVLVLLLPIGLQAAYSVYVGGDAWEWLGGANRYLCVVMPLFFVLAACGLAAIGRVLTTKMDARAVGVALTAVGVLILVQVNSYQFIGESSSLGQWLLLQPLSEWPAHERELQFALALPAATTPQARIAVTWAGIVPYFSERAAVDLLGKNDRVVAKGPDRPFSAPPNAYFRAAPVPYYCWPGHTKHDYRYSIGQLQPDVVPKDCPGLDEIGDVLQERYVPGRLGPRALWIRKDSREVTLPSG